MKPQPDLTERDRFDELLQAVGKQVEATPEKGWEPEPKTEETQSDEKANNG